MRPRKKFSIYLLSIVMLLGCKTNKAVVDDDEIFEMTIEETLLDTLVVSAPRDISPVQQTLPVYRAAYNRVNDLVHTKLDLRFDWSKQHVIGTADLLFTTIRTTDKLELHAQNFLINEIRLNGEKWTNYDYNDRLITIYFDESYPRGKVFSVQIDYVARPSEGMSSGSAAITSDRGLFFINPDGSVPNKPQQIWTQGETEHNSRWFPTIDKPNERCTQEIILTVDDRFKTLSNGLLISSRNNNDGTRTDHWKQEKAHAPYLFMIAVGEFHVEEEEWNQLPLMYYVEADYAKYAKDIFQHTPEMLSYFSELLDYEYPWEKYAQVIVRDYVSGAMENTTAVIFGEFVQKNGQELIDNHNDLIVAHELFHHWFGDLVTCESWSNLTLNEGFANYGEYLWMEHKYGKDYAEAHRLNEMAGYLESSINQGIHPLIHYSYDDKEHMFDAHSYNKGGLVLHSLRNYLGDEIFFLGLNRYLELHEYTSVEAHELRMAMEDVSGEDLNWFFNQWYFDSGHPEIDIHYNYDSLTQTVSVDVEQLQDHQSSRSIFQIPFHLKTYLADGQIMKKQVLLNERKQTFNMEGVMEAPKAVVLDGDHIFLGIKHEYRSLDEWTNLFLVSDAYQDKYDAINRLRFEDDFERIISKALKEDHHLFREMAAEKLTDVNKLADLVEKDPHSYVRQIALISLYMQSPEEALKLAKRIISTEQAYPVLSTALDVIANHDTELATKELIRLSKEYAKPFHGSMFRILSKTRDPAYLEYFESQMHQVDMYNIYTFFEEYMSLIKMASPERIVKSSRILEKQALDDSLPVFRRYLSTFSIHEMKQDLETRLAKNEAEDQKQNLETAIDDLNNRIEQIIDSEQDSNLRAKYGSLGKN